MLLVASLFTALAYAGLPYLSDEALTAITQEERPLFALFTSDTCQRCGSIENALVKARPDVLKHLLESGVDQKVVDNFDFVKLDLHNNSQAKQEFQVEGVPTLLLVKPSHVHEYGGPTSSASLSKWLTKRLVPTMQTITDDTELAAFVKKHEVAVVLETDEESAQSFSVLVESLREIPVYGWIKVSNEKDPNYNRLRIFKRGLEKPLTTTYKNLKSDSREADVATLNWLYENQIPLFGEINLSNLHAYLHVNKPFVWFVGNAELHAKFETSLNELIKDEKLGGQFWFVWLDPHGGEANSQFIKESLRPSSIPGWVITDYKGPGRFHFREKMDRVNRNTMTNWLTSVLEDKAERQLLSDPIPVEDIDSATGIEWIVTDNLEEKLLRHEQPSDLFLVVESMWCQDCPQLLAAEVQVAHALKDSGMEKCVRVARIEAHSNELHPDWDLLSSSAYLFPKDETSGTKAVKDQKKIPFEGEPTGEGLINFLKTNGKCKGLDQLKSANIKVSIKKEEL